MRKAKVVIIHGTHGNPNENWIPWLATQIARSGHEVVAPAFPTPEGQNLDAWFRVLDAAVDRMDERTILIGHSLGAGFILRILERAWAPVGATFLASSFVGTLGLPEFDSLNSSFVTPPFAWDTIRENAGSVFIYHGDNDPYVPIAKAEEVAQSLAAPLVLVRGGGHLNAAAGFTRFDLLWDDLQTVIHTAA